MNNNIFGRIELDGLLLFNATFIIARLSIFTDGEAGVPRENNQHTSSHWQSWSHNSGIK